MASTSSQWHLSDDDYSNESVEDETNNFTQYMHIFEDALKTLEENAPSKDKGDPSSSQPNVDGNNNSHSAENIARDYNEYLPLYKAVLKGDWESARSFFEQNPDAITAKITESSKTALHLAVGTGKAIHFVEKLVELMPAEALELTDENKETALSVAAIVGNTEAAKILVNKNPELPHMRDREKVVPLHRAIQYRHRETILYLLQVTRDDISPSPYAGESGVILLLFLVIIEFYDLALDLLQRFPHMATTSVYGGKTPLSMLAVMPYAFPSGSGFNFWQRFIYFRVPLKLENFPNHRNGGDVENPTDCCFSGYNTSFVWQKLHALFWEVFERLVPSVKNIRETKVMHHQTLEIIKRLCTGAAGLNISQTGQLLKMPLIMAAIYGIPEIIEEIIESVPPVLWYLDTQKRNVFQLAVINRRENVFNLLYQMSELKHYLIQSTDILGNNILHFAGNLAPPHQLNLVSGAALQMQRELQWYKEVEKFVQPVYREAANVEGKTPAMVFTEAHKELVKDGAQWMKDTASSCTVVSALIATVVFAGAIKVPGGNPIFSQEKAFIIFAVSDTLSLFSAAAAIIMFLSILTARYAEADFLYALPKRLIIGLLTLSISITSMMIAFTATLYLVFGKQTLWILISMAASACFLVTLFVYLQFPLLLDIIYSTYGPGIFGKRSNRPLF